MKEIRHPLPQKLYQVLRGEQGLEVRRTWYRKYAWPLLAFVVIWNTLFFYATFSVFQDGFNSFSHLVGTGLTIVFFFFLPFGAGGVVLAYYNFCLFYNQTVLRVSPESGVRLNTEPYSFTFYGYHKINLPKKAVKAVQVLTHEDVEYDTPTTYSVALLTQEDLTEKLFSLKSPEEAEFLKNAISRALSPETAKPVNTPAQSEETAIAL
jgi:hypothetical protein